MSFWKDHDRRMEEARSKDAVVEDLLNRAQSLVSELQGTVKDLKIHLTEVNSAADSGGSREQEEGSSDA